jgi:predicted permease
MGFLGRDDRRARDERAMTDEMRFHVDMEAAELERFGVPRDEARRRALANFGGVRRFTEEAQDARRILWLDDLRRDVRYSLRSLARSPGYAVIVVLTLALAIAANTSIFSVANGILFKRLPYRDPSRLLVLWDGLDWIGVNEAWVTGPEVAQLRRDVTSFEGVSAVRSGTATIGGELGVDPQQVSQSTVSANFFQVLGAGPVLGRAFNRGEDAPGMPRVAVISHRLFTQRFGGDHTQIGRPVLIDGRPTTIVGVLPAAFQFAPQASLASSTADVDIYATMTDTLDRMSVDNHSLGVLARVRGDVTMGAALAELSAVSKRLDGGLYLNKGFRFVPVLLQERMVREVRPALLALLAAVAMLMLIVSANLAVLALVRGARREHELTIRRAIGASQSRVARQILTETLVLSLAGAAVGIVLGSLSLRALLSIAPTGLPRREEIGIDLAAIALTVAVAIVVGLAMGLAPVLQSTRRDIVSALREKTSSRAGARVRRALVLAQLTLSMMLLAGTGLLLGSFARLMRVDPGFDPSHVLTVDIMASRAKYATGQPVVDLFARQLAALRAVPGFLAVAATSAPPLSAGADQSGAVFPGSPTNTGNTDHDRLLVDAAPVTSDYFRTMGITMLAGHELDASQHDSASSRVVIIDDLLAERFFPKREAIGQIAMVDGDSLRIIGVARHVRLYGLDEVGRAQLWLAHAYTPYRYMSVVIRTAGDPMSMADAARRAIHGVDPDQAIAATSTMEGVVRRSLAQRRLVLILVGVFALAGLLLVALGVYGITANIVAQRTRELGIRMALGANRQGVIWNVLGEPTRLVAAGLVLGLCGTMLAGRLVQRLLYGVSATDPVTLIAVSVVLLGVAVVASYLPARRATRVDPVIALRSD